MNTLTTVNAYDAEQMMPKSMYILKKIPRGRWNSFHCLPTHFGIRTKVANQVQPGDSTLSSRPVCESDLGRITEI